MDLSVIILAAGQGTRMYSQRPKILHKIAGVSMLERVVDTASQLSPKNINVVYGHGGDIVKTELAHLNVTWVRQEEQLGTGHAVQTAMPNIENTDNVLILYGDVPVISVATLQDLIHTTPKDGVGVITAELSQPDQLGRIVRDHSGNFVGIIEYKDASPQQRQINEVNSGLYLIPAKFLNEWLPKLSNTNAQGEYYLTDVLSMAVKNSVPVVTILPERNEEVMGVNNRVQQAELERYFQSLQSQQLMLNGVTILDPKRIDIRGDVTIEKDVILDVNVVLEGKVTIRSGCRIGANSIIRDCELAENVHVHEHCVLEGAYVSENCNIGPFARLRPGADLQEGARIGNFVEVKKSTIGKGSKVNHLSYIGDACLGDEVNVGAGTITCNYDGVEKHKTEVGDKAFIGSGTQLVAPVTIGEGAFIGAGSTITRTAPAGKLSLSRAKQQSINGWQPPKKKEVKTCVE